MSTNKVNGFSGDLSNGQVNGHVDSLQKKDAAHPERKPFILKRISNAIITNMENGFYRIGDLIGSHPWKAVFLSLFVVGIFSAGVANFKESSDRDELWVPEDSSVYTYKNWVDSNFETTTHFVSVIFVDSNLLTPSKLQTMYQFYDKAQNLKTSTGKNFTDLCVMSGDNCYVTSVMELWSYDETDINAASQSDIKTKIKTTTTSPMFYKDFDPTTVLGGITYSSGDISEAKAAKITWFLNADTATEDDSMLWETLAIDLALKGQSGISEVYVFATRRPEELMPWCMVCHPSVLCCPQTILVLVTPPERFGDVGGDTIQGDITLLSAGYMLVIVFIIVILGRFNWIEFGLGMAVCGIMVIGVSIGFSFGLASAAGWLYTPLHSILPFLLLGIGVDDLFVVVAAYKNLPTEYQSKPIHERIAMTLKHAGVSITVTSLTDMCAFGVGATTVLPALKSFCVFSCLGILALYLLSVTFFVACVALNAKRADANRNSLICCYTHRSEYQRNKWSQKELIALAFKQHISPFIVKLPAKIVTICVTLLLLGIGIWGFVILEQEFDPIWFLPTDSYPYKFDEVNNNYFPSAGESAAVYCKDLDYYNSEAKFITLYNDMTNASFVSSGSVDSWFRSYTSYLSTATAASVTSKIDGTTKYPTSDQNFHDLLQDYVTTVASGKRHSSNLKFSGTSPDLDLTASYLTFRHTLFKNSAEKIKGMEDMMALVANIFPDDVCFAYGREYLSWYTNKVIQTELYRNLGIAALCVFVVCLVLIANFFTSLMVFSCVLFTLLDVGGMMHFWGLTIDTVTSIILILAIGLAVDYSAHIGHCFMTFTGDRNGRVKATLVEMGAPVFSGGFSTFLAFILLAGSNSYVFTTFFKVFLLVVIFGLFHGLVYLPTLLSWLGPAPYDSAHQANRGQSDVELEIKSSSKATQDVDHSAASNKENQQNSRTPPPDYTSPTKQQSNSGKKVGRITPIDD